MATHSSPLAWKVPWTEEPGGLQSLGSRRVGHDWAASLWLSVRWAFVASCRLSLVAASGGHSPLRGAGFSLGGRSCGAQAPGPRASAAVVHGLSCSKARGIFLGVRPVSPVLAGEFLLTKPPPKSQIWLFNMLILSPEPQTPWTQGLCHSLLYEVEMY